MDASRVTLRSWTGLSRSERGAIFSRTVAIALAIGLVIFAVLLFVRRISGAFDRALPDGVFIVSIAVVVVWAAAIRLAIAMSERSMDRTAELRFVEWSPTLALPLIGVAMAVPGTSMVTILAAALLVAGEEYWAARFAPRSKTQRKEDRLIGIGARGDGNLAAPVIDGAIDRELWQEQRRFRGEREEMISGVIRCRIAANDRLAIEHVAFCPPLATVPQVELEPLEGAACRARVTHVFRYGARIEIKLDGAPDQPTECLVAFEARSAIDPLINSAPR